jgi:hypothetical protein
MAAKKKSLWLPLPLQDIVAAFLRAKLPLPKRQPTRTTAKPAAPPKRAAAERKRSKALSKSRGRKRTSDRRKRS